MTHVSIIFYLRNGHFKFPFGETCCNKYQITLNISEEYDSEVHYSLFGKKNRWSKEGIQAFPVVSDASPFTKSEFVHCSSSSDER